MSKKVNLNDCRAFKIWLGLLGYHVKPMKKDGFYIHENKKTRGYMTDNYDFSPFAKKLFKEFMTYE